LRIFIAVAAFLLLAGCETDEDFWRPYHYLAGDERAGAEQNARATKTSRSYDTKCVAVARQRALDARENGYDIDMENTIYQGTYKDCVAWDSRHPQ
jgi:hypothetical protein